MRSKEEWTAIYDRHCKTVWNICYPYFMNPTQTEDAVQETFLRLVRRDKPFQDEAHEKAWLIAVARNVCRDELKRARQKEVPLAQAQGIPAPVQEPDDTLLAIRELPEKYRVVIYLYYYEGYSTAKIAQMLHKPDASIRTRLHRGRSLLKERLGGI